MSGVDVSIVAGLVCGLYRIQVIVSSILFSERVVILFFIHGIGVLWGSSILYWALRLPNTSPKTVSEAFGCPEIFPSPKLLDLVHRMYFYVTRTTSEPLELDPDFTPEEHEEFERLEREHPYVEQHEEKVPVPPRPEDARDGKHDVLFLVLFILFAAVFLIVIVFGVGPWWRSVWFLMLLQAVTTRGWMRGMRLC